MSSEGSSDRVNLGNAFEGDCLSSLAPRGRKTMDFSWTDSSRQESASRHDNDVEGSSRPVGGQDEADATFSSRIEVSCADNISMITIQDDCRLAAPYELEVQMPSR